MRKIAKVVLLIASLALINPTDSLATQSEVNKSKGGKVSTSVMGESDDAKASVERLNKLLADVEQSIQKLDTKSSQLQRDVDTEYKQYLEAKRLAATKNVMPSRGTETSYKSFYVKASAYTDSCRGCTGRTATGLNLRANPSLKVIAVDPKVIPLGSKVWVDGYGYAVAADTGGAIRGNKIDVFMPNESDCYRWGVRQVLIKILK